MQVGGDTKWVGPASAEGALDKAKRYRRNARLYLDLNDHGVRQRIEP